MPDYTISLTPDQASDLLDAIGDASYRAEQELDKAEQDNDHEAVEVYRGLWMDYSNLYDDLRKQINNQDAYQGA